MTSYGLGSIDLILKANSFNNLGALIDQLKVNCFRLHT